MAKHPDAPMIQISLASLPKQVLDDLSERAAESGNTLEQEVARILIDHVRDSEGA